jgi:hypothetical protein
MFTQHEPKETLDGTVGIIFGSPKIGKSTFGASLPNHAIIDTEDGTRFLKCNRSTVTNLDDFWLAMRAMHDGKFQNNVIDTIDKVYAWCEKMVIEMLNKKLKKVHTSVEEFEWGLGYAVTRNVFLDRFIDTLDRFKSEGRTVWLISHQKHGLFDTEKEITLDFPGKTGRMIAAKADYIGLVYGKKLKRDDSIERFVSFKPYDQVDSGSRLKSLAGEDIEFSYDAIIKTIDKYVKENKNVST